MNILGAMDLPEDSYHELDCYYTWMGRDGIARTKVKPNSEIELHHAKANSEVVNDLAPGPYPIIVDMSEIKSISKEAREHYAIRNRKSNINAIAIVRNSPIGNVIANFFIGLSKPSVPTRIFNSETDAVRWCRKIK